ncbi:hypothetical protein GGR51DRAFT_229316 [Nemania sp. FL0031]|nr:hypothetical protein GGR51DRAFT_229316 [Nemania sp. FL0031]
MATPVISGTTRTNLGPLTTDTWTYTCTEVIQQCSNCRNGWAAQTCISGTVTDNQDCWPPRTTGVPATSGAVFGWGVYSPGIVCPGGYTSAVGATYGGSSDFNFQYPLTAGETAIGCCPLGGYLPIRDSGKRQTCVQYKPSTSFLVGSCHTDGPVYTSFSLGNTLHSMTYKKFVVSAPMYQAVFQSSDLSATSTSISTVSQTRSSRTSGTNAGGSGNTSAAQVSDSNNRSSGLQKGVIAGIAIGTAALVALIAAAVIFLWLRGRKRRHALIAAAAPKTVPPYPDIEQTEFKPPLLAGSPENPVEVNGMTPPAELHHPAVVAELDSSPNDGRLRKR